MPARTIQAAAMTTSPEQVSKMLIAMAGMFDDPLVQCRATWGALDGGTASRKLRLEVIDRLAVRYPPTAFRNKAGLSPGRWIIAVWFGSAEHASPVAPGVTWTTGLSLGDISGKIFVGSTDMAGYAELQVVKGSSGAFWAHHAVLGLWRSTGIDWDTGADAPSDGGDPPVKGGGGGGPVII